MLGDIQREEKIKPTQRKEQLKKLFGGIIPSCALSERDVF